MACTLLLGAGATQGGELGVSGLNTLRYGDGSVQSIFNPRVSVNRVFREEILDLDLTRGLLRANLATALVWPSELPDSPPRTGEARIKEVDLVRRSLEWNGPVNVQVGHFWTTFGNGLALSLYRDEAMVNPRLVGNDREELPTSWDSRGDGALVEAMNGDWTVKALWGQSDYVGRLAGGNLEWTRPWGSLGGSLVRAARVPKDTRYPDNYLLDLENRELYGSLRLGRYEFSIDHVDQQNRNDELMYDITDKDAGAGLATYATASAPLAGWSLLAEYKYYRFARQSLYFNSPPTVQREFPTRLIARSTHRVFAYNDETGLSLNLSRSYEGGHSLRFSGAWASRIGSGVLPQFKEALNAYQEYTAGWLMEFSPERRLDLGAAYTEETNGWLPGHQSPRLDGLWYRRAGLSAALLTPVPVLRSLELAGELMRKSELQADTTTIGLLVWSEIYPDAVPALKVPVPRFEGLKFDEIHWVSVFPAASWSLNLTGDYEQHSQARQDWMGSGEARADFHWPAGLSHTLTVFYGRLRGGQVCSNGNCRIVAPFNGVKVTLASQF